LNGEAKMPIKGTLLTRQPLYEIVFWMESIVHKGFERKGEMAIPNDG
jgi:hypothetical protein